ncbi:MAG: hypothetical protein ACUVWV_05550 [Thermodesulfobacteriota bacterium]
MRPNLKFALEELRKEIEKLKQEVFSLRESHLTERQELQGMLKRRGLHQFRENPVHNLFFPPSFPEKDKKLFYELFKKYSFRLFLREIINCSGHFRISEVIRFSTPETGKKYIWYLRQMGLVQPNSQDDFFICLNKPSSLGPTLEWFMAEVLKREFYCPAIFGLRCKGSRHGGDYDVVASLEGKLLYLEVKSSPPKNIAGDEVHEFLSRVKDLSPQIALFFVDTELRLIDKIIPIFETEQKMSKSEQKEMFGQYQKIGREVFFLPPHFYIFGSKGSIIRNLGLCLQHYLSFPKPPKGKMISEQRSPIIGADKLFS